MGMLVGKMIEESVDVLAVDNFQKKAWPGLQTAMKKKKNVEI